VGAWHRLLEAPTYLPLGTTAHKQSRMAGETAVGSTAEFAGAVGAQVVKMFKLPVDYSRRWNRGGVLSGQLLRTCRPSSRSFRPARRNRRPARAGEEGAGRLVRRPALLLTTPATLDACTSPARP